MTRLLTLKKKKKFCGDFPGSPVVKTLFFQCRGHGFLWSLVGELRSHMPYGKAPPKKTPVITLQLFLIYTFADVF